MAKAVHKVFFSYAQADAAAARQLRAALQNAGFDVFDPEVNLLPGSNWAEHLGQALHAAQAMIVLLSPDAAGSSSVARDIEYAVAESRFAGRLIPVMVRPTRDFPWILKHMQMLDFNDPDETGRKISAILGQSRHAKEDRKAS